MAIPQGVRSDRTRRRLLTADGDPAVFRYPEGSDLSGAARSSGVANEPGDVPRPLAREFWNGRSGLRRLAARVVPVVLDEAVRLPRRYPDTADGGTSTTDVAADRSPDGSGHVVVRDRLGPGGRVTHTRVTRLCQRRRRERKMVDGSVAIQFRNVG